LKRFLRICMWIGVFILLLIPVAISATIGWRPFLGPRVRPLSGRTFERTPERLARGKYIVENVSGCTDCHSPHDWSKHDSPILPGMEGAGSDMYTMKGLPGRVVAPNITPDPETGTGNWSDDALARAIREGIGHDGRALFPIMPYQGLKNLSDEDVASVVVVLRSLPPVRNPLPATAIIFPVKYLIRGVPQPITTPMPTPDLSDPMKRGAFLVEVSGCRECHTPQSQGQSIPGMDFAGGFIFDGPWGKVASANLTPSASGIPYYDETLFLQVLRTGYVKARALSPIMPWHGFRNMTDEDLKAIFVYLKTVKPVDHVVDNTEAWTDCPICKQSHGGGSQNHNN
jgi:hypothetical protein